MLIVDQNPEPMSPKEFAAAHGEELRQVIYKELESPVEANRQSQIAFAKRNYLYMSGKQYLVPQWANDGRMWDWKPVEIDDKNGKKRKFASTYNIIYADGAKFIAVVGQRPPNMKAVPNDPMRLDMVSRAKNAQTAQLFLQKHWDLRRRMKEVAFHLWSTSAVYFHTDFVTNAAKNGSIEVPEYQTKKSVIRPAGIDCGICGAVAMGVTCPECGGNLNPLAYQDEVSIEVPYVAGKKVYPKGRAELTLYTTFEVGHSFGACTLEELDWISLDTMDNPYKLKAMYDVKDITLNGAELDRGSVTDAQLAKEAIEAPNGVAYIDKSNNWLHSRKYIRPVVYDALAPQLRKQMESQFPEGARVVCVGSKAVIVDERKIDDYWAICKTGTGPKISDPPLCNNIIPIQDDINDMVNMGKETILRGIPKTLVDGTLFDPQAVKENEAIIGEMIRVKMGAGQSIGSLVQQMPVAKMSEQMMPFIQYQRELSREIDGVQPAIYGGGAPATTFRAENQRKNQALMQLSPPFEEMQNAATGAVKNGVKLEAKFGVGEIKVTSNTPMSPTRSLDLSLLQVDGWDLEADESVPVSINEKRDQISGISQENPGLASALGFDHPMNTEQMQRTFGVDGFYTPGAAQQQLALAKIQVLLREQAVDDIDPMTGQPVRLPSQMPDPYEFKDAAFMSQVFHAWVLSDAGQELSVLNPAGFENVKMFGTQLDIMAAPPMMPGPVGPGEPPPQDIPPPPPEEPGPIGLMPTQ